MKSTEFTAVHLKRNLTGEHEPLLRGEPGRQRVEQLQLLAQDDELLELDAIDDQDAVPIDAVQRQRALERRLHRAATRQGPAPVVDP